MALTNLRVFNEDIEPGQDGLLSVPMHLTDQIVLDHDQNDFTIDYTALSFRDPDNLSYSYRLDPLDRDWVRARNHRSARYSGLQPGDYTFRVMAVDSRGVVSLEEASMAVIVLPPWWKTIWAYLLYAMLFIGAIVAFDRFQRRRIVRKERDRARERELEQAREIETAYNQLREAKDRLVQQEKLASLGQLTAGIAHEIKNPLNFVTNFASINSELADELEEDLAGHPDVLAEVKDLLADLRKNATVIAQHGQRADSIVRSMMQHASGGSSQKEPIDINAVIREFVGLAYHGMRAREPDFNCSIEQDLAEEVGEVPVVSQDFGRVLVNLLGNAFDALYEKQQKVGGEFAPEVRVATRNLGEEIEIRISDNGDGIPEDVRKRIFEPFFTTKPTGSGTGLGLSLSHEIITKGHSGSLGLDDTNGGGATFVIKLPRH
jgi:signal transduction histidine kinase